MKHVLGALRHLEEVFVAFALNCHRETAGEVLLQVGEPDSTGVLHPETGQRPGSQELRRESRQLGTARQQHLQRLVVAGLGINRLAPPGPVTAVRPRQSSREEATLHALQHRLPDDRRLQHLRQVGIASERSRQILHETRGLVVAPKIVRPLGKEGLRIDRRLPNASPVVALDLQEQRPCGPRQLERMLGALHVHRDDDAIGLPDRVRNPLPRAPEPLVEAFPADGVHGPSFQLALHVLPTQQGAHTGASGLKAVARRHDEDHRVAMDPRPLRAGRLDEVAARQRARFARLGNSGRAEHGVAETAVIAYIPGRGGQHMDDGTGRAGAVR